MLFGIVRIPQLPNSPEYGGLGGIVTIAGMRDFIILIVHVIVTVV